jgi:UDP-glucose 4-epimerase
MELTDKRLLVIGGAGFIGSHVVEQLLAEDPAEVLVYDNFTRGSRENLTFALRDPRVHIFPSGGDILHRDVLDSAMQGVDGVLHFAALWLLHCQEYPRSAFDVNVTGTLNVLEACVEQGVKRLVYSSSASVYGDAVEEPMTEDHPLNNNNFYGATKIAGEQLCRSMHHRYRSFEYVGLRYMNVYGSRQDYHGAYVSVVMKMLDRIDAGLSPIIYGDGSQAYDFVHVSDVAAANICALKANTNDQFYNVGTGIKTSIREIAELLLELTDSHLELQFEPAGPTFVTNRVGSTAKAAAELGFQAQVPLREGLKELIEWRRADRQRNAGSSASVNG